MDMKPTLSILICGTPTRAYSRALPLVGRLLAQLYPDDKRVEVLYLLDNKKRSVGAKRQALLDIAQGDYVAYVDDDDDVAPEYCAAILGAIEGSPERPDVVTFDQVANIAGHLGQVSFGLGQPNENFNPDAITKRNAWHVCAWRRELAQRFKFPDLMDGEDWAWAEQLCLNATSSVHIDGVLHFYTFNPKTTEATGKNEPQPQPAHD